jgi:hypothetical protein
MCIPSSHARSFAVAGWYQAFAAATLALVASLLLGVEFDRSSCASLLHMRAGPLLQDGI